MPADTTDRGAPARNRLSVALVTLGCARNEVDSEELAGRLALDGWDLVEDVAAADVALVNTCGFVAEAKKDSIDTILEAADLKGTARTRAVVAVGCLAERYGAELAEALPEADAVLGFDDYAEVASRLRAIVGGQRHSAHTPRDRRLLLPISPVERQQAHDSLTQAPQDLGFPLDRRPGHDAVVQAQRELGSPADRRQGDQPPARERIADLPDGIAPASGPRPLRRRLTSAPYAPLKLASGCDRRCSFCAIPSFRGSFLSRRPSELLDEARWLAEQGVRELVLVSENSTSYGKDLGDLQLLETLLPELAAVDGIDRVRVSYLQPAELRPGLVEVLSGTPGVAPYFDLSFQHASEPVLRRMRRFGGTERFVELLGRIRDLAPQAGVRSNFIVGFPGETEADLAELERFLEAARLDAVGVFGYSDEDGTEAAGYDGKLPEDQVRDRAQTLTRLAEELSAQRAEDRIGELLDVLVEARTDAGLEGRAAHQGPEVDGTTTVIGSGARIGELVRARVMATSGVDLIAEAIR